MAIDRLSDGLMYRTFYGAFGDKSVRRLEEQGSDNMRIGRKIEEEKNEMVEGVERMGGCFVAGAPPFLKAASSSLAGRDTS